MSARHPGFFGKLPAQGDFVAADLDPRFHASFDEWLHQGMAASRRVLGETWDGVFLAAPAWRFALPMGLCGPDGMAGVILPTHDRIGRCFPLIVAARTQSGASPLRVRDDQQWFTMVEAIMRTILWPDFDLTAFRDQLRRLPGPGEETVLVADLPNRMSVWWTEGEHERRSEYLTVEGLPSAQQFHDLITARSAQGQSRSPAPPASDPSSSSEPPDERAPHVASAEGRTAFDLVPAPFAPSPTATEIEGTYRNTDVNVATVAFAAPQAPLFVEPSPSDLLHLQPASTSHQGLRASMRTDADVQREAPALMAVIAGGGQDRAAVAVTGAVAAALMAIEPHSALSDLVSDVRGKMGRAHALVRDALSRQQQPLAGAAVGASVVILVGAGTTFAVLWAGDARCYLVRDGMMRCLTRDHASVGMRRRLERAIGGMDVSPRLDVISDELRANDRFLLCSGSLTRILPERLVAETLLSEDREVAARLLLQDALLERVPDNVTVLVVDALKV